MICGNRPCGDIILVQYEKHIVLPYSTAIFRKNITYWKLDTWHAHPSGNDAHIGICHDSNCIEMSCHQVWSSRRDRKFAMILFAYLSNNMYFLNVLIWMNVHYYLPQYLKDWKFDMESGMHFMVPRSDSFRVCIYLFRIATVLMQTVNKNETTFVDWSHRGNLIVEQALNNIQRR